MVIPVSPLFDVPWGTLDCRFMLLNVIFYTLLLSDALSHSVRIYNHIDQFWAFDSSHLCSSIVHVGITIDFRPLERPDTTFLQINVLCLLTAIFPYLIIGLVFNWRLFYRHLSGELSGIILNDSLQFIFFKLNPAPGTIYGYATSEVEVPSVCSSKIFSKNPSGAKVVLSFWTSDAQPYKLGETEAYSWPGIESGTMPPWSLNLDDLPIPEHIRLGTLASRLVSKNWINLYPTRPFVAICLVGEVRSLFHPSILHGNITVASVIQSQLVASIEDAHVFVVISNHMWRSGEEVRTPQSEIDLRRSIYSSELGPSIRNFIFSSPSRPDPPLGSLDSVLECPAGQTHSHSDSPQFEMQQQCMRLIKHSERIQGWSYSHIMKWRPDVVSLRPFPPAHHRFWALIQPGMVVVPGIISGNVARDIFTISHREDADIIFSNVVEALWSCHDVSSLRFVCGEGRHFTGHAWCECIVTHHYAINQLNIVQIQELAVYSGGGEYGDWTSMWWKYIR